MSINEINEQAKESLKKYFKDSQDIQHDDDTKKQLTIEEMYQSVDDEIKEQEKKLEELHQMRHALQHNAKEAYEAIYGKEDEKTLLCARCILCRSTCGGACHSVDMRQCARVKIQKTDYFVAAESSYRA